MSAMTILNTDGVEQKPLREFTEKAYLDYAMAVILDRALPHLGDGLKPVQRRIIYAMSELGLKAGSKFKKSARTVGDVLGKFHPHSDSACYEAMVLMAQDFSYRYPFIDGQGNWGSSDDPKSFAAMRYTESRLSAYANALLSELGQGTVDYIPNFDATLLEPATLPARLPNLLLNGASGIAVGMATDIPPHNLNEVIDACIHLLDKPKSTLADVLSFIQGPDYPTNAEIITHKADIAAMYEKGQGSLRLRGVYHQEKEGDVIITALPHQVSGAKILEQIANQMRAKKLPMLVDLRDESDHENPTRLVLVPKSNRVDVKALMSHLFATTDLERSYRVNLNMIGINGKPQVKNLLVILKEWLSFRKDTVTRRLKFRLDKVLDRLHILDGLMIAFLNIDEVIQIIREADNPKQELCKRFKLSERQADAILDLKLRHLAKLEEEKIKGEQNSLDEERESLEKTLSSDARLKTLIKKELKEDAKIHGDARRSPLVVREEAQAIDETELVPTEAITVVLSKNGWVRAAKGHEVEAEKLNYKAGDGFLMAVQGRSNQDVVFFDDSGRSYTLKAHTLPSARGQGEPLSGRLSPPSGAKFIGMLMGAEKDKVLLASDAGYGFITTFNELLSRNKNGKSMLKPPKGSLALPPLLVPSEAKPMLALASNEGRLLIIACADVPELTRGKGNKLISIPSARVSAREEYVEALTILGAKQYLNVYAGKRHLTLKEKDLANYQGERGRRGLKLPRGLQKVERLESLDK